MLTDTLAGTVQSLKTFRLEYILKFRSTAVRVNITLLLKKKKM